MWHSLSLCSSPWASPLLPLYPDHFTDLCWLLSTADVQFRDFCIIPYRMLVISKIVGTKYGRYIRVHAFLRNFGCDYSNWITDGLFFNILRYK